MTMSESLQHVIAGAAAAVALAWLIRDRVRRRAAGAACEGCALMQAARGDAKPVEKRADRLARFR